MQCFRKKKDNSLLDVENFETTGERCCHLSWRTPLNIIVYVHRNEPQFTYIYVYHTNVLNADNIYKNPPPNFISPIILCHFYFVLGLHPWLCWKMERSQIPSCPRQLHTCTRLMQGWVTSAGCFPPPQQKSWLRWWLRRERNTQQGQHMLRS